MADSAVVSRQAAEANGQALTTLTAQLRHFTTMLTPAAVSGAPAPPAPATGPSLSPDGPKHYDGDPESCHTFLTNCSLLFSLQPRTFATEAAKVANVHTHLSVHQGACLHQTGMIPQFDHLHLGQDQSPYSLVALLSLLRSSGDGSKRTCVSTVEEKDALLRA